MTTLLIVYLLSSGMLIAYQEVEFLQNCSVSETKSHMCWWVGTVES